VRDRHGFGLDVSTLRRQPTGKLLDSRQCCKSGDNSIEIEMSVYIIRWLLN
jgi:hypothetical protein